MALKTFRPVTPSLRYKSVSSFEEITKRTPEKSLLEPKSSTGGRDNYGHVSAWHRGGGHKRRLRNVDFKRDKHGIPAKVAAIEYDPNRSARLALLHYADGEKRYILAPIEVKVGMTVMSGPDADIRGGNALPLRLIPLGTNVHNVEMVPKKGGQIARSAGSYCQLVAREGHYATLKMPSGEMRMIHVECLATIGQVGNVEHENIVIGKAGKSRWLGRRGNVRGVAMNPVDHPLGGGEGKSSGGRHPCTPWGKPTKGYRTRNAKPSDKYIVRRRSKG